MGKDWSTEHYAENLNPATDPHKKRRWTQFLLQM
jgi:hypothetical protein